MEVVRFKLEKKTFSSFFHGVNFDKKWIFRFLLLPRELACCQRKCWSSKEGEGGGKMVGWLATTGFENFSPSPPSSSPSPLFF